MTGVLFIFSSSMDFSLFLAANIFVLFLCSLHFVVDDIIIFYDARHGEVMTNFFYLNYSVVLFFS